MMTDYIEEMMMTVGVEKVLIECSDECPNWNKTCSDDMCPAEYPDFTSEKQLEIIKLFPFFCVYHPYHTWYRFAYNRDRDLLEETSFHSIKDKDFTQALAQLTTELMKAGELDKGKVRKVLES